MILKPVTAEEFKKAEKVTAMRGLLEEFVATDTEVCVIEAHHYSNAYSCCAAIKAGIERWHMNSLSAKTIDGKVYLFKKSVE